MTTTMRRHIRDLHNARDDGSVAASGPMRVTLGVVRAGQGGHHTRRKHPMVRRKELTSNRAQPPAPRLPASRTSAPVTQGRMVYVLSDSTGNLARHMLTAFLTQVPRETFTTHFKGFIQTDAHVRAAFEKLSATLGRVVHAVISTERPAAGVGIISVITHSRAGTIWIG
jgi:hypothetical protein